MSKDLLLYTQNLQQAKLEIENYGGRVTQQFTETVFLANIPDSVEPETLQKSTTVPPESLDLVSQLAKNAWNGLQEKKLAEDAPSATEGLSWDTPGYSPPSYGENQSDAVNRSATLAENPYEESTGTSTSRYMVGSIAVGVIIVSGIDSNLTFSPAEQQEVIQEVQKSLNFLASAEPRANITFVYDIRLVTVSSLPGSTDTYENAESPWRDAALQQMGFQANRLGSVQYVQNLKSSRRTNWAYVGYFTKYPLHNFAYAVDEKVCMNYFNDGWGPDQINRVFAHETCHIFGAADEYGKCSCGGSYGHLSVPNNNCVNCNGSHVSCLMDGNVLEICQWSRGQIGWHDRLFPSSWSGWSEVGGGGTTNFPLTTAVFNNRLYLFGVSTEGREFVNSFDASNWSGWSEVGGGGTTNLPLTTTVFNNRLYLFGVSTDGREFVNSFDGSSWSGWSEVGGGGTTNLPLTTAVFNNRLYLFGVSTEGREFVNSLAP